MICKNKFCYAIVRYKKDFLNAKSLSCKAVTPIPVGNFPLKGKEKGKMVFDKTESFCLSVLSLVVEYKVFKTLRLSVYSFI